jgi:putative transposase
MAKNNAEQFSNELLDQLLAGRDPKSVLDSGRLIGDLKKALPERMLNAEMDVHLAREAQAGEANHRNGSSAKTVLTPEGALELSIPRDRHGRFDPALIGKYRRRFPGFDDKIIALYVCGMSTRDIQGHIRELYRIEISPDLVSAVTDSVIDEVTALAGPAAGADLRNRVLRCIAGEDPRREAGQEQGRAVEGYARRVAT